MILRVFAAKEQKDHESTILNVTFDCAAPRALARFWGEVTGWPVIEEPAPGGARVLSDRRPELGWAVLADPEGNEFCVEISAAGLRAAQTAEAVT
jgi:hypothetical protein